MNTSLNRFLISSASISAALAFATCSDAAGDDTEACPEFTYRAGDQCIPVGDVGGQDTASDAGGSDTGATDSGATDTGATDTGAPDSGPEDAGNNDVPPGDAGGGGVDERRWRTSRARV